MSHDNVNLPDLWLWIRRRGGDDWRVKYPAWDRDEFGGIEFLFDDLFFDLCYGRYEGELRYGGCPCGSIEIDYRKPCVSLRKPPQALPADRTAYPTEKPVGAYPMYDALSAFSTTLCGVLEKGVRDLPLSLDDREYLCGVILCCPVQLVLSDGVYSEVVEFSGCTSDRVEVARGMASTVQRRFAPGTKLYFAWTEQNTKSATVGCGGVSPSECTGDWVLI